MRCCSCTINVWGSISLRVHHLFVGIETDWACSPEDGTPRLISPYIENSHGPEIVLFKKKVLAFWAGVFLTFSCLKQLKLKFPYVSRRVHRFGACEGVFKIHWRLVRPRCSFWNCICSICENWIRLLSEHKLINNLQVHGELGQFVILTSCTHCRYMLFILVGSVWFLTLSLLNSSLASCSYRIFDRP